MNKFALPAERATQLVGALTAFVFFVYGVVYLCFGHWPVTHLDYWALYEIYFKHTWFESALRKDAEHLMFFPTLLWLADLRFFHGNQELLFVTGLVLLFTTAGLLLIPVWRDQRTGLTAKLMATLAIIVGNFWMARRPITASGGFNCICSLLMASAALAFLLLPRMKGGSPGSSSATLIVVCAGFVTSFSFGVGLAIWPTLLFLVWCLRLPWRSFLTVGAAAVTAIIIYEVTPPLETDYRTLGGHPAIGLKLVAWLCRLVGGPFFYAASAWPQNPFSPQEAQSSVLSLWCGGVGLGLAILAMTFAATRRDLLNNRLKLTGIALVAFNFVVLALITFGNYFRGLELGFIAPRYLFWSTLFWTGLLLLAIHCAEFKQWLRWPVWLTALALPVVVFPMHYRSGLNARWVRTMAECGAVSLVNGVRDESQLRIFGGDTQHVFREAERVYRVAGQLRVRRLDMFADGLQDWIGRREADVFGGRYKPEKLEGRCSIVALVQCDDGAPAARVTGQATSKRDLPHIVRWAITPLSWLVGHEFTNGYTTPETLVIIDQDGVVRGIARSSSLSPFVRHAFYLDKVPRNEFCGYIRNYDPNGHYVVRSADGGVLSEGEFPVQTPVTGYKPRRAVQTSLFACGAVANRRMICSYVRDANKFTYDWGPSPTD